MAIELELEGTVAVVIGGTSGINRGIAERFADLGARVAVASRSPDKVADTIASLRTRTSEVFGFTADVRDFQAVADGLAATHERFGQINTLISGAAGNFPATANGMSANAFRSVVEIDLLGTFHVLKAAYPYLVRPGASVINISAPQSFLPFEAQSHVSAAKAGVDMLTRSLALEWGPDGIRVNSVVPGPIDGTEGMARLAPTEDARAKVIESVPLRRFGRPDDVAGMCLFLASSLAGYVSGAVLPVDGGWSLAGCGGMSDALRAFARDSAA